MTAILWVLGFPFFFLFLFIPLVPFLGQRDIRRCPACGFETAGPERFCPYDGSPLAGPDSGTEKTGK